MEFMERTFEGGSKFTDGSGNIFLLHKVGNRQMQLTNIDNGDVLIQFATTNGKNLCVLRDMPSDSQTKETVCSLTPLDDAQKNKETDTERIEKEKEKVRNEISIYVRELSDSLIFSIRDSKVDGEAIEQSDIVKDVRTLIEKVFSVFVTVYNEIRDKKMFFENIQIGFESLHNHIINVITNPEFLYPDVTAKFFFNNNGKVQLLISDEKEDVLLQEGHLKSDNTVLTTKAMKYVTIPILESLLIFQD